MTTHLTKPTTRQRSPTRDLIDRTATVVLFVLLGFAAVALVRVGAVVSFAADVCGGSGVSCTYPAISAGAHLAS